VKKINPKKVLLGAMLALVMGSAVGCVVADRPYYYELYRRYDYVRPYDRSGTSGIAIRLAGTTITTGPIATKAKRCNGLRGGARLLVAPGGGGTLGSIAQRIDEF